MNHLISTVVRKLPLLAVTSVWLAASAPSASAAKPDPGARAGEFTKACHKGRRHLHRSAHCKKHRHNRFHGEKFLYVVATDGHGDNPDFLALIGTNPAIPGHYGRIFKRVDVPYLDDELHHFGYSLDQKRLIIPGLFSNRVYIFDVSRNPRNPRLVAINEDLVDQSGYIVPHTVIGMPENEVLITMIGALSESTGPGGIVRLDDRTGEFLDYYGPGPHRNPVTSVPGYMYDFGFNEHVNRAVSTTFGWPADVGAGINPAGFGNEVAVWDFASQEVIQTVDLGENCGALEVRWIEHLNIGMTNCPGTNSLWVWEDEDRDGFYDFHQVLSADDGLAGPVDMVLTENHDLYITNYFGDSLQKFDISDPYNPALVDQVSLPHPNMIRVSPDGHRVYVSNQLVTTWDNDENFGGPRNDRYGIWLYHVQDDGTLAAESRKGRPWVDFTNVRMKNSRGPAGPHQMFFDPSVELEFGHH
jgi:selenium-binding protein 1